MLSSDIQDHILCITAEDESNLIRNIHYFKIVSNYYALLIRNIFHIFLLKLSAGRGLYVCLRRICIS